MRQLFLSRIQIVRFKRFNTMLAMRLSYDAAVAQEWLVSNEVHIMPLELEYITSRMTTCTVCLCPEFEEGHLNAIDCSCHRTLEDESKYCWSNGI